MVSWESKEVPLAGGGGGQPPLLLLRCCSFCQYCVSLCICNWSDMWSQNRLEERDVSKRIIVRKGGEGLARKEEFYQNYKTSYLPETFAVVNYRGRGGSISFQSIKPAKQNESRRRRRKGGKTYLLPEPLKKENQNIAWTFPTSYACCRRRKHTEGEKNGKKGGGSCRK